MSTSATTQPQSQPESKDSAECHVKAAESCSKAATEHTNAARAFAAGDEARAVEHAKSAERHCSEAWEQGKKAKAA